MGPVENPVNNKEYRIPGEAKEMLKSLASKWEDIDDANSLWVIPLKGAMTNEVFQIKWPTKTQNMSRKVVVRIYGEGVEVFFDRDTEILTFEFMSKQGQGPRLLGRFSNGRIEEFIHARTLSASDLHDPDISALIAAKMKEFHGLEMPGPKDVSLWHRLRNWLKTAKSLCTPEEAKDFRLDSIEDEISLIEKELSGDQSIGFCHNDLQYGNIMVDEETRSITIIDYEYASYNPIAFDIANHFCEMTADYHTDTPHILDYSKYPGLEERQRFLHIYLSSSGGLPSDIELEQPYTMLRSCSPPLLLLRMLSLSPHTLNPNPTFLTPMKSTTQTLNSSQNHNHPLLFSNNPKVSLSNSHKLPQNMTVSSCFSGSASTDQLSISGAPGSNNSNPESTLVVVSFYKFADFPDYADMRKPLKELCEELRVSGGIILAPEGINGSICGTWESVENVLGFIQSDDRLKGLRQVESPVSPEEEAIHHGHTSGSPLAAGEDAPFRWDHVRVKLKKEIVTLGMPSISPNERVGKYVKPRDWNALISDPDTVVVDVRNNYETRIGKFKGAVDPCTSAFREFPSWVGDEFQHAETDEVNCSGGSTDKETKSPNKKMPQKVAMYCTGGIRCEKATSFLLNKGFKEVYHLEGGILKYLEEIPKSESLWEGECFVFDKRVSVEHGLEQGTFKLCYGCKQPVSDADMEAPEWEYGVSCPYCHSSKSEEEKERARARQRQFETWGVIGGPDKGRRPTFKPDSNNSDAKQQLSSTF